MTRLYNERVLDWNWQMYATLGDGSPDVVVAQYEFNARDELYQRTISRLSTRTGLRQPLSEGAPAHVLHWALDAKGVPRAAVASTDGRFSVYRRGSVDAPWSLLVEGNAYTEGAPALLGIGARDELYLTASVQGFSALMRLEPGQAFNEARAILRLDGYDFGGQLVSDRQSQQVLGAQFETDAPGVVWFDEGMKAIQAAVDQALPNSVNTLDCQRCGTTERVLITAEYDRKPKEFYVYHRASKRVQALFPSRPWFRGAQMGERDMHRYPARDGLSIPLLVTRPAGKSGPRPAVVLVHGGPYVRGTHWPWEAQAQFLASRGYVVLEPEFRGSDGYGFAHFRAGWKQWGLAMQDDIADGLAWAVKQGWVDPGKVCIAGASYGGYAALMGLAKHPDLYQCAVSWAGVTDINLMYSITWSDFSNEWKSYGMPVLVGDPVQDAEQLKATSPVLLARKMRQPILLAYGTDDQRVPLKHGAAFRDAVQATNRDVEWVTYPDEGHGWLMLETQVDFWSRVEKFLERNLQRKAGN